MKKLRILSLLPALILCSCGVKKNKWAGTYQFRLGKSDGNHMEVTAVITDENDPKVEGYKVMTLTGDLGDQLNVMKYLEELEDMIDDLVDTFRTSTDELSPETDDLDDAIELLPKFISALKEEVQAMEKINFFYKVSDHKNAKYGNRIELGTHAIADLLNSMATKHPELEEVIELVKTAASFTDLFTEDLFLMPDKAKYAFNAFINKKGLTFQVPISRNDLSLQFMWYGFDGVFLADVEMPENYIADMPGVKGEDRFGTHPAKVYQNNVVVKDEAAEVNEKFKYYFSNSPLYDAVDTENTLSKFVLDESEEQSKIYMVFKEETFQPGLYEGKILIGGEYKDISLNIDEKGKCLVEHNGKKGLKEGFFDNNQEEFRFRDVVKDPFEFRDFNIVDVGLSKVEL